MRSSIASPMPWRRTAELTTTVSIAALRRGMWSEALAALRIRKATPRQLVLAGNVSGLTILARNGEQMSTHAEEARFVFHRAGRSEDVRALLRVGPPIANEFSWPFDANEGLKAQPALGNLCSEFGRLVEERRCEPARIAIQSGTPVLTVAQRPLDDLGDPEVT